DRVARPHLLQTTHDHPLARLQAVGDLAEAVVESPHLDGAGDDGVLLIHGVEGLLTLVGLEGALADGPSLWGPADGRPNGGEQTGEKDLLLVGKEAPHPYGAGLRVDLVVHEVDGPGVWVALLVRQPQGDGEPAVARRVGLAFADELPNPERSVLVDVEIDVH